uniref:Uncharacterized protein n=1 Tax=Hubei lepidoptera virus 4 TaxID=1922906 RepID=A0A1L3KNX7_9VIRU|nr:hypothetical protein 3 [Hubei lepidoptera virus 4]
MKRFNAAPRQRGTMNPTTSSQPSHRRALQNVLSDRITPEQSAMAKIYNRVDNLQVESLRLKEWNGFVELTDECQFGLALFDVQCDSLKTSIVIPLKDVSVTKDINIVLMKDLSRCEISLNTGSRVAMPLPYLDAFTENGVKQFIHETRLVGKLVVDIKRNNSVRDRWIPNFIQGIPEIEDVLNDTRYFTISKPELLGGTLFSVSPRTIGQYLLLAMCERMRLRIAGGMGLKVLFYAISLIARFAVDNNFESLNVLLIHVIVWITRGTCDDCLVKMMRYLHGSRAFEYSYHLNDSFSKFIRFDFNPTMNMEIASCTDVALSITSSPERLRNLTLKTIGRHSFLTSPEASKRIRAQVTVSEQKVSVVLYPTARQLMSLITILDLHSRVLRAHDWNQSVHAFNAWFAERRIDMASSSNDLMDVLICDLIEVRRLCPGMDFATSHLIILLSRGVLPREMILNYKNRPKGMRAHEFIVNFVFYVAPSAHLKQLADIIFTRLQQSSKEERLLEISFTIENPRHSYEICPAGMLSEISKRMHISEEDREITQNDTLSQRSTSPLTTSTEYMELPSSSKLYPSLDDATMKSPDADVSNDDECEDLPDPPSFLMSNASSHEARTTTEEAYAIAERLGLCPIREEEHIGEDSLSLTDEESISGLSLMESTIDGSSITPDDNIYMAKDHY